MHILGLLGMYFDTVVVFVTKFSLLFRLALAILCNTKNHDQNSNSNEERYYFYYSYQILNGIALQNYIITFLNFHLGHETFEIKGLEFETTSEKKGEKGEIVFCYQNCSDLLQEKVVLVIEKNF